MTQSNENETQPEVTTNMGIRPCLHDPRPFVKVLPSKELADALRPVMTSEFRRTCPFNAIPGSRYCRPHTIMNNAVTPELQSEFNLIIGQWIHHMSQGYVHVLDRNWFRDTSWPYRFN